MYRICSFFLFALALAAQPADLIWSARYVVTMDDKMTWTKSWTVKQEYRRQGDQYNRVYKEPRCHEGNFAMIGMLSGARTMEMAFAEGRGPDPATINLVTPTNSANAPEELDPFGQ